SDHHCHPHPGHLIHPRHPAIHGGRSGRRWQRRGHRAHLGSGGRGRPHPRLGPVHRGDRPRHLREHGPSHERAPLGDRDGRGHHGTTGGHQHQPHPRHHIHHQHP